MENPLVLQEQEVPKTMADALEYENPAAALLLLAESSSKKALIKSHQLAKQLSALDLQTNSTSPPNDSSILLASVDSISHSLVKIASGGSEASSEIQVLEQEKQNVEQEALDVETALSLRTYSQQATNGWRRQDYKSACLAIQQYTSLEEQQDRLSERALAYAGTSTVDQILSTKERLETILLEKYKHAVQQGNLQALGDLTPLLQQVSLQQEGVRLYMEYLKQHVIQTEWPRQAKKPLPSQDDIPIYITMARIYNCAVSTLRHHLPLISHCLYQADGDVALVQLVHASVQDTVIPLLQQYIRNHQLHVLASNAQQVSVLLEQTYTTSGGWAVDEHGNLNDDCGFSTQVGSMAHVNAALEEAALVLQHAESYTRFLHHVEEEIQKARKLRFQQELQALQLQRERHEWTTGKAVSNSIAEAEFQPVEILAAHTQLHQVVAEVGGYYCGMERCLLLASMQRAFCDAMNDANYYSPCGSPGQESALKTSLVEKCLYAARHSMQRAFATGHSGTAAASANFCSDILGGVLLQVMTQRAQESGVALLKPEQGLLGTSSFLASNILSRQGQQQQQQQVGLEEGHIQQGVAHACATLNDLQVAVHHVQQLERVLMESIDKGFAPHDAEQLRMCVKSLSSVADSFQTSSESTVESLLSVLSTRVRSIVNNAVGSEASAASATFMGSSVAGVIQAGGQMVDKSVAVKMNYNLDEETYQLLQLSEGYMMRMCLSLDELIQPLRLSLVPRLADATVLGVVSLACKRIESAIRRCKFTALGALSLDSDMRDLLGFVKDCLDSPDLKSNVALYRNCTPLARLMQISKLLNVDDLEDVLDLISASKRKGNWDLKLEDAKSFLCLRVEFEGRKVNELLRISEDE